MSFTTVPVIVAGPSYPDRSRPLSTQTTRNFYHQVVDSGKDNYVLKSFPGLTLIGSVAAGTDRGLTRMGEFAFRVVGAGLYQVDQAGNHVSKGVIPGSGRCIFANDGINLFISTERLVYHYNGASVTQVTDSNIDGAKSVAFFNNRFAYTHDALTVVSTVGDGSTASGLDSIGAESLPDNLVRDYWFDQVLYRFGERSVESWYDAGTGRPPIARIEGQIFSVGCAAMHSIINSKDALYWLGDDRRVYRTTGGVEAVVSTDAISYEMEQYTVVADCFATEFVIEGQQFIAFTFPTEDKTWVLKEGLGANGWMELSSGTDGGRYQANDMLSIYGKTFVSDVDSGQLYTLDLNNYTLNGDAMQRVRVMSAISGNNVSSPGKRLQMSRFELILDTGVGAIAGQGSDPQIMLEASYDGGKSYAPGTWMRIGRLGETSIRAEWYSLKTFYTLTIRLTITDPVDCSIYAAAIDLRKAGR